MSACQQSGDDMVDQFLLPEEHLLQRSAKFFNQGCCGLEFGLGEWLDGGTHGRQMVQRSVVRNGCGVIAKLQACSALKDDHPMSGERWGADDDLKCAPRAGLPGEFQWRHHSALPSSESTHGRIATRGEHDKVIHGSNAHTMHDSFGKAHPLRPTSNGSHEKRDETDHQQ
jgi:hypothetical protein